MKLTNEELKEIKLLKDYYGSLDLDQDSCVSIPKDSEKNLFNGLSKLLSNYENHINYIEEGLKQTKSRHPDLGIKKGGSRE
jgi:hypothetical protein